MGLFDICRECRTELEPHQKRHRLCEEHEDLAGDYQRFDDLREEGHSTYVAKLMAGLADPPDPDDD